jgi:beta-carotene 3-hydroxylase
VTSLLVAAAAFLLMEPFTYAAHRWIMHGPGERLHRSHHVNAARNVPTAWEANDVFPLVFASAVMGALALGFNAASFAVLVPVCIGVTVYGAAYFAVHDLYIHRRIRLLGDRRIAPLERLADAHRMHHATNGEPYGMLMPIVRQPRGSRPSHAPVEA